MSRLLLKDVDRLEIMNLTDNFTDILMAGSKNVERAPFGRNEDMPARYIQNAIGTRYIL